MADETYLATNHSAIMTGTRGVPQWNLFAVTHARIFLTNNSVVEERLRDSVALLVRWISVYSVSY
jgi:hypothetical protein